MIGIFPVSVADAGSTTLRNRIPILIQDLLTVFIRHICHIHCLLHHIIQRRLSGGKSIGIKIIKRLIQVILNKCPRAVLVGGFGGNRIQLTGLHISTAATAGGRISDIGYRLAEHSFLLLNTIQLIDTCHI